MKSKRMLLQMSFTMILGAFFLTACGPPPPPPTPTNIRTDENKNIDGIIVIEWDALESKYEGKVKYRVYRDTELNGKYTEKLYDGDKTQYVDKNVIIGEKYDTKYYYRVTSYYTDADYTTKENTESDPATSISAFSTNFRAPKQPDDKSFKVQGENLEKGPRIVLEWKANSEVDLAGYRVFRSEDDKPIANDAENEVTKEMIQAESDDTTVKYIDKDIEPGKRYYYTVYAYDKGGKSSDNAPKFRKTDVVIANVEQETPTDGETVSPTPTFKWKDVDGAAGYILIVQTLKTGGDVMWNSGYTTKTTLEYKGKKLTKGERYYWLVYAFTAKPASKDAVGNSGSELWPFDVAD